ncbi:MAG: glycosyltransferase family 39 protein, partial [Acidobacteriales bacterium]|nr:glycosyltransferase family 39 protein [Terriglobales bacterium]
MQEAVHTPVTSVDEMETRRGVVVQVEVIAYLALLTLALVLRLAELGSVPLSPAEAPQALAAWRVSSPMSSGQPIVPPSALLFALQSVSFALLGGTEAAARVATVLAGAALVISPALFRGLLGRGRALILSVLLLCSPVLLTASRFSSPAGWSMLFAVLALWGVWQWSQTRKSLYAVLALVMGAGTIFLTEPGGPVLALVIVLAGLIARTTQPENR